MVGLFTVSRYIDIETTSTTGNTTLYSEKYLIEPPEIDESFSFIYILIAVFIGTALALLIIKFKRVGLWRVWFFLSVFITLTLGLLPYIEILFAFALNFNLISYLTAIIAAGLAFWKVFKPNVIVANVTEVFIYSGIAALLVPILDMLSAILLLIAISVYDVWAVNKTKHMVSLAKFQSKAKTFAGLSFPYIKKPVPAGPNTKKVQQAILGGGDIAFPLLFAGVVLKTTGSFALGFLISLFAAIGLFFLFLLAKKGKFYPAMPFITVGCLVGWIVTLIL